MVERLCTTTTSWSSIFVTCLCSSGWSTLSWPWGNAPWQGHSPPTTGPRGSRKTSLPAQFTLHSAEPYGSFRHAFKHAINISHKYILSVLREQAVNTKKVSKIEKVCWFRINADTFNNRDKTLNEVNHPRTFLVLINSVLFYKLITAKDFFFSFTTATTQVL